MLSVAVAWSFIGCIAIRYVLPVLWMTSFFHTMALWRVMCIPKRRTLWTTFLFNSQYNCIDNSRQILLINKDHAATTNRIDFARGKICYVRLPYLLSILEVQVEQAFRCACVLMYVCQ